MTLSCLDNLVGLRGACSDTAPSSGLYINDLPGITVQAADAAISIERESGLQLLRDKLSLAKETLKQAVRSHFASKLRMDSLIESDVTGYYPDDLPALSASGRYAGIQLRFENVSHAELVVSSLRLQMQATGDIVVKIFDLIAGKQTDSITVSAVAGEITEVVVNKTFQPFNRRLNLFFAYDTTGHPSYKTTVYNNRTATCCGLYQGWYGCGYGAPYYTYARAAEMELSSAKTNQSMIASTYTAGMSITHSLICSVEPLLCQMAPSLALPLLYKWASEVMSEMIYSKRLNSVVTLYAKDHQAMKDEYEFKFSDAMDKLLQNIRTPNDICYSCNPRTRTITHIP